MLSNDKYKLLLLTLFILSSSIKSIPLFSQQINAEARLTGINGLKKEVNVILIDAGHGGKDQGCSAHELKEKDVALQLALKTGAMIEQSLPNVSIRYTRTTDEFIPLHKRAEMANEDDVDLFISIHCNAIKNQSAHGFETYVMGNETSLENLEVAQRENSVIQLEDNSEFDPYSDEGHIMLSLIQQQNLEQSIMLADLIQQSVSRETTFRNRGVKQAGFVVLRKVVIPSILIEAGFISNSNDAFLLKDEEVRNKIAHSIVSGVASYISYYQSQ